MRQLTAVRCAHTNTLKSEITTTQMKTPSNSITRLATILSQRSDLVSCNVYVSAGRTQHAEPLLNTLKSSQELCQQLRRLRRHGQSSNGDSDSDNDQQSNQHKIAIVHAYADGPYDRSSFHVAGCAENVALVASHVAITAIDGLQSSASLLHSQQGPDDPNSSKHPLVGIVDHVSIMPLNDLLNEESTILKKEGQSQEFNKMVEEGHLPEKDDPFYVPSDSQGLAALYVAHTLTNRGVKCYPYGSADPNHTPLAIVRKQKTSFFKSGGLSESSSHTLTNDIDMEKNVNNINDNNYMLGICTVGSPPIFVENFNVRLTSNVTKKRAMALTKKIRERDGGVVGVEALTLPYSNDRFEAACNLLQPTVGTADCILAKVKEWVKEEEQTLLLRNQNKFEEESFSSHGSAEQNASVYNYSYFIDDAYRVGTTLEQCMGTLALDEGSLEDHDTLVYDNFEKFLLRQQEEK